MIYYYWVTPYDRNNDDNPAFKLPKTTEHHLFYKQQMHHL